MCMATTRKLNDKSHFQTPTYTFASFPALLRFRTSRIQVNWDDVILLFMQGFKELLTSLFVFDFGVIFHGIGSTLSTYIFGRLFLGNYRGRHLFQSEICGQNYMCILKS